MTKTEIRRHELECKKKLQENTSYGDLLKSVRTAALSFGGSILKEVAEEAKKEVVKDTKEDAVVKVVEVDAVEDVKEEDDHNDDAVDVDSDPDEDVALQVMKTARAMQITHIPLTQLDVVSSYYV
nr:hypothetical protein [Tanacetum cinerariifolium]